MQQCLQMEEVPLAALTSLSYAKHTKISCFKKEMLSLIFVQVILLMIQLHFKTTKQ